MAEEAVEQEPGHDEWAAECEAMDLFDTVGDYIGLERLRLRERTNDVRSRPAFESLAVLLDARSSSEGRRVLEICRGDPARDGLDLQALETGWLLSVHLPLAERIEVLEVIGRRWMPLMQGWPRCPTCMRDGQGVASTRTLQW